jgi:hypothetical protein
VFLEVRGPERRRIQADEDVRDATDVLRLSYQRVVERHGLPEAA